MWEAYKKGYKAWLQLEKSLADNSVQATCTTLRSLPNTSLPNTKQKRLRMLF